MAELAEGTRLLSEYGGKPPSRVRIPVSPPPVITPGFHTRVFISRQISSSPSQKKQITLKNPASWRDFTSISMKIKEFNKAKADPPPPFDAKAGLWRGTSTKARSRPGGMSKF
jgi:hypothetical protein